MSDWCRTSNRAAIVLVMGLAGTSAAISAQQTPSTPAGAKDARGDLQNSDPNQTDIVVQGYRQRKDIRTSDATPTNTSVVRNRQNYEYAERMARCAGRSNLSDLRKLRAVVDGMVNSATHAVAQDRLKRIYITCSEGTNLLSFTAPPPTGLQLATALAGSDSRTDNDGVPVSSEAAPLGHSLYDRGAFVIEAIKRFAPELTLTPAETNDPIVQTRFNAREIPRNRYRLPVDYRYFATAVCLVRVQPSLSVRLAKTDGPARANDLQAALIDQGRVCFGGAKRVRVDPTQFRIYIADAVYRWAVAARGVDSLIPTT